MPEELISTFTHQQVPDDHKVTPKKVTEPVAEAEKEPVVETSQQQVSLLAERMGKLDPISQAFDVRCSVVFMDLIDAMNTRKRVKDDYEVAKLKFEIADDSYSKKMDELFELLKTKEEDRNKEKPPKWTRFTKERQMKPTEVVWWLESEVNYGQAEQKTWLAWEEFIPFSKRLKTNNFNSFYFSWFSLLLVAIWGASPEVFTILNVHKL